MFNIFTASRKVHRPKYYSALIPHSWTVCITMDGRETKNAMIFWNQTEKCI